VTHDLIFISIENWDDVWRRNQFVVHRLARRHPRRRILWVNPPDDVSNDARHGRLFRAAARAFPNSPRALPQLPNLFLFTPAKLLPNSIGFTETANNMMMRSQLRKAAREVGIENPLLWINPHYAAHLAGRMDERAMIYDVGEDWSAMATLRDLRERIIAQDLMAARKADAIIVCCQHLADLKSEFASKVHVIPNGVDLERYESIYKRALAGHPLTRNWSHPVLGHTGTLHSDRTDVDLVVKVARAFPQGTIALIGPDSLNPADRKCLLAEPNIRLTGPMKNAELPSIMSAFDVCLVPHQVNPFSDSQNPLKLFEYLASGLPIVSTPINGFRDFPELIHLASDAEAFNAAIGDALVEPVGHASRRQQAVSEFSWDVCADRIEDVIESVTCPAEMTLAAS
jgi:glycosyltransferase involved in cell wall biosynthesis